MPSFAKGELACGRSFDPATGEDQIMLSYPADWTLEATKARLAPDLDLTAFEETSGTVYGRSFFARMVGEERRETVLFKRRKPQT
ncbi:hypothetical protein EON77_01055 [bacterium]|nr:MAG: hypothetical protein EON77_01055 [bacterium]